MGSIQYMRSLVTQGSLMLLQPMAAALLLMVRGLHMQLIVLMLLLMLLLMLAAIGTY